MDLLKNWRNLSKKIKGKKILLLLDYDGTLTPIVARPGLAVLTKERRKALRLASKKPNIILGIISGRTLKDIKRKIKIPGIFYSGNHGFEIEGPKLKFTHKAAKKSRPIIQKIKNKLKKELKNIKGAIIEDKGITLSLHYRLVQAKNQRVLKPKFFAVAAPYLRSRSVKLTTGKKVYEIRPPVSWDKGKAILWLLKHLKREGKLLPIYAGDDTTDESVFQMLRGKGITIVVGKKKSKAKYFVNDVDHIYKFINLLLKG